MKKTLIIWGLALAGAAPALAGGVRSTPLTEVVQKALPCVVCLGTERPVRVEYGVPQRRFRGEIFDRLAGLFRGAPDFTNAPARMQNVLGSGVVIHPRGYILTNFHVTERASKILVTLADGRVLEARYVAGDEWSDVALIQVAVAEDLPWLELRETDDLLLGETVVAVGNAFGMGPTVTAGILSARNREARYQGQVLFRDVLQTDAAFNPGSSGGPLLDMEGRMVGLNVAMYPEAHSVGFATPASRLREHLAAWLSPRLLQNLSLGFEVAVQEGRLVVEGAAPGSARQPRNGDQIVEVQGVPAGSLYAFYRALILMQPGDTIDLLVRRDGREVLCQSVAEGLSAEEGRRLAWSRLGLSLELPERGLSLGPAGEGLEITGVDPKGPLASAGLSPGQVVARMGGTDVNSLEDVGVLLAPVRGGEELELAVWSRSAGEASVEARSEELRAVVR